MTNSLVDEGVNQERVQEVLARPTTLLVATDGTPQSDAAVALAHLLSINNHGDAKALTVVDRAPIPWGTSDTSLVAEYERGLRQEARDRAKAQIDRFGDKQWTVEVRTGEPASTISTAAREARARLIIVGLGGHGPAARFFGNETALRLIRTSQTPVLAVHSRLRELPKRIMVAMDFSESSIEAAQLALAIAAPAATVTLVHVVPWERKDYIPERWFREHEAYVASQLTRVTGWLERSHETRMHQRVLFGKPGTSLLACAEELDADLIVAGTHGRNFLGKMLGGETVGKLVRRGGRSVLILPAPAAFQRLEHLGTEQADRGDSALPDVSDARQTPPLFDAGSGA